MRKKSDLCFWVRKRHFFLIIGTTIGWQKTECESLRKFLCNYRSLLFFFSTLDTIYICFFSLIVPCYAIVNMFENQMTWILMGKNVHVYVYRKSYYVKTRAGNKILKMVLNSEMWLQIEKEHLSFSNKHFYIYWLDEKRNFLNMRLSKQQNRSCLWIRRI